MDVEVIEKWEKFISQEEIDARMDYLHDMVASDLTPTKIKLDVLELLQEASFKKYPCKKCRKWNQRFFKLSNSGGFDERYK